MSEKPTLLIVDDEEFNLTLLRFILEDFELVSAHDGVEALEKLGSIPSCDAIVLDWMMPNMDGIQLLKALKANPRYCGIPVVMQTAAGGESRVQEAMKAGAHAYVLKPYDDEVIVRAVRDALRETGPKERA